MSPRSALRRVKHWLRPPPAMPPCPTAARHALPSMILSEDDQPYRPSPRLMQLAKDVIRYASEQVNMDALGARVGSDYEVTLWPGEHYVLLGALVAILKPKTVVEIGTYTGVSALAMKQYLPADGRIVTFDVKDRRNEPEWQLNDGDFADGRLEYRVENLADAAVFDRNRALLEATDFFLIDGPKDGKTEFRLVENFKTIRFRSDPIILFDDTRLWSMLHFWRTLPFPKLDLTSFGHWSGSGLVEWATGDGLPRATNAS